MIEYKEALAFTVEQLNKLGQEGWKPCSVLARVRDKKSASYEEFILQDPAGLYTGLLWRETTAVAPKEPSVR